MGAANRRREMKNMRRLALDSLSAVIVLAPSVARALVIGLVIVGALSAPATATTGTLTITTDTVLTEDHFGDIVIAADGVTLDGAGHTVTGLGSDYGILLIGRTGVTVKNCTVTGFQVGGIELRDSNGCTLENNTATSNTYYGIRLLRVNGSTLRDNSAELNAYGIRVWLSENNHLQTNTATDNSVYGIHLGFALSNTLEVNLAVRNQDGCVLGSSDFNTLRGNTSRDNVRYGIRLLESDDNTLEGNTSADNDYQAISLDSSTLDQCTGNLIFHNNFIGPRVTDRLPSANDWHHPVLLEGNYWSLYTGVDDGSGPGKHAIAGDGIGDTLIPYPLAEFDNYPFTNEYGTPPDFQLPFFVTGDLFAISGQTHWLLRIDADDPTDLSLIGACNLPSHGIIFDEDGRLYRTFYNSLKVYDRNFQLLGEALVSDSGSPILQGPVIRKPGQVIACDRAAVPTRLMVFDTTDPSDPVHTLTTDIGSGVCSSIAVAANGDLWLSASGGLLLVRLDDPGNLVSVELFSTYPTNPVGIAFQASTGRMFLGALNANKIEVVDSSEPTTPLAVITDVCDTVNNNPGWLAFDSSGNLLVGCSNSGPDNFTDVVGIPAASLAGLTGTVTAASLGAVRFEAEDSTNTWNGASILAFKPKGKSRDPFTVDAGNNITIRSDDLATLSLVGDVTNNALGEVFASRWYLGGTQVGWTSDVPNTLRPYQIPLLAVGNHVFTFEVEGCMLTVSDTVIVAVENSPPTAAPSGGGNFDLGENLLLGGNVADHDGDTLSYEWLVGTTPIASGTVATSQGGAPVALPAETVSTTHPALGVGVHTITLVVDDGPNDPVSAAITVEIIQNDITAPTCAPEPSTTILWPPNHKMVDVTIAANATDDSGGPVTLAVSVAVSDAATGGDNTEPDYVIVDDGNPDGVIDLQLRAERAGKGDGRTYTITITATDEAGNSTTCEVEIQAPHSKGTKK